MKILRDEKVRDIRMGRCYCSDIKESFCFQNIYLSLKHENSTYDISNSSYVIQNKYKKNLLIVKTDKIVKKFFFSHYHNEEKRIHTKQPA